MSSDSDSDPENQLIRSRSRSPLTRNIIIRTESQSNIVSNIATMAHLNFKMEYLQMIPEFTGNQSLLTDFITNSEELITQFYDQQNPNNFFNKFLLKSIKTKIKGDAAKNISSYTINNWQELKNALLASYSDKRDLQTLKIELCNMRQGNLKPLEFFNKVQNNLNMQISHNNMNTVEPVRSVLNEDSQKLALRVFLKHLNNPIGDYLSTRNPNDLSSALHILTNDFNITDKNIQKPKIITQRPMTLPQNFRHAQPMQQRQIQPGPSQTNVFKPKPSYVPPKPTPMSISTRNTYQRPTEQFRQNFRPHQNFISEELHNNENSEVEVNDQPAYENYFDENEQISNEDNFLETEASEMEN